MRNGKEKTQIKKRLQKAIRELIRRYHGKEGAAIAVHTKYPSINNWLYGRTVPSEPVLRKIEEVSGVKILDETPRFRIVRE